jgi:hypothetical protein
MSGLDYRLRWLPLMSGPVPRVHVSAFKQKDMDGQDKPGHDGYIKLPFLLSLAR